MEISREQAQRNQRIGIALLGVFAIPFIAAGLGWLTGPMPMVFGVAMMVFMFGVAFAAVAFLGPFGIFPFVKAMFPKDGWERRSLWFVPDLVENNTATTKDT